MDIHENLRDALSEAMRRRDTYLMATLRSALSALANAESVPIADTAVEASSAHVAGAAVGLGAAEAPRKRLSDEQQRRIIAEEIAELTSHAERLTVLCRHDEADAVRRGIGALKAVLDAS